MGYWGASGRKPGERGHSLQIASFILTQFTLFELRPLRTSQGQALSTLHPLLPKRWGNCHLERWLELRGTLKSTLIMTLREKNESYRFSPKGVAGCAGVLQSQRK